MPGPAAIPHHHPFVKAVVSALRDRCKVPAGAGIVVAVSGGADSVALLRALAALGPLNQWRLSLAVGHVQHHLRDEAEDDAAFVASLAKSLNLPYLRADLSLEPRRGNLEGAARTERYAALTTMARAVDASFIATAHQGDDQLETLLMRMMRGASVRGLRGIRWRRPLAPDDVATPSSSITLIRPLLAVNREQVLDYLRGLRQDWREDHTNQDVQRRRARLRRDVLPVLRELKPDVAARSTALADHLRRVAQVLHDAVAVAADRVVVSGVDRVFDRTDARTLRRVVLAGLLRRLLLAAGASGDRLSERALAPVVRAVHDQIGGERSFDFTGGARVVVTRNEVIVRS